MSFQNLDIRGATGFLIKATLLKYGYIVVIKATSEERQHRLQAEIENYQRLRELQGEHIPVCLGSFKPDATYSYAGKKMTLMMILSWSGKPIEPDDPNIDFYKKERNRALGRLSDNGVTHCDRAWRNMLWDEEGRKLIVIDLEDMRWSA